MSSQTKQCTNQSPDHYDTNYDDWQQYAERGKEQLRDIVADNAGRSMLLALGAGLGVGLLIGTTIGGSSRGSRLWDRSTAEGVGRSLLDKIETLVPAAVSNRFNG